MILSLVLWIIALPLVILTRDLEPKPIWRGIRSAYWEMMKWVFPIFLAVAIILYFVYLAFRPIILGITLGIVDIKRFTPFKEFWGTGVFDWIIALLTLNPVKMYYATKKLILNAPRYARELFGGQIAQAENITQSTEQAVQDTISQNQQKQDAYNRCLNVELIQIHENMSAEEKTTAESENIKIKQSCKERYLDTATTTST